MANVSVQVPPKKDAPKVEEKPMTRQDAVEGMFQLAGLACITFKQYADAGAIAIHTENISKEVVKIADQDERIASAIDSFLKVGPYAGLIGAVLPLVLQISVNHKMLPADKLAGMDILPPEMLEARIKTEMAQMQLEALKEQQKAEAELAKMRAEMEQTVGNDNTNG